RRHTRFSRDWSSDVCSSDLITAQEWEDIKVNKPEVAEQELDVFSDLVWEGVLNKVEFIEHISPQQIHLFYLKEEHIHLIAIKIRSEERRVGKECRSRRTAYR